MFRHRVTAISANNQGWTCFFLAIILWCCSSLAFIQYCQNYTRGLGGYIISIWQMPFLRSINDVLHMQSNLSRLEHENIVLRQQLALADVTKQKLAEMQQFLQFSNVEQRPIILKVLATSKHHGKHSLIIKSNADVKNDQLVFAADGLLGRIIESDQRSARVLLLSDINSQVPVDVAGNKGILCGNAKHQLSLKYISNVSQIKIGSTIITSGDGGIFPAGIKVAVVEKIIGDEIIAKASANFAVSNVAVIQP